MTHYMTQYLLQARKRSCYDLKVGACHHCPEYDHPLFPCWEWQLSLSMFSWKETDNTLLKVTDSLIITDIVIIYNHIWSSTSGELTISEGIEHQFTVEEMDDETYTGLLIYKWVLAGDISSSISEYIPAKLKPLKIIWNMRYQKKFTNINCQALGRLQWEI